MEESGDKSLACNLTAMTATQRKQYEVQKERLREAVKDVGELPNGYAFYFASEPGLLSAIAEFIEGERRCCAFYTFHLEIAPDNGKIGLKITGPEGTRSFIRDALVSLL